MQQFAKPGGRVRRSVALTEGELARLIAHAPGAGVIARRNRALLEVLYGSGLRVAEAVGLDVGAIDLARGTATVLGKGARWRSVPLTAAAACALRAVITWRTEGPVFRCKRGARMGVRLARKVVAQAAEAAGLPHSSPHSLRHACASHMLAGGAYLFHVAELLGHTSTASTTAYLHRQPVGRSAADDFASTHPRA